MITHVLDTSAILAHFLNEPGAEIVNEILAMGPAQVGLPPVVVLELHGRLTHLIPVESERARVFEMDTRALATRLPFSDTTTEAAIRLRASTRPRLPTVDALIAASASEHNATLVHRDPHLASIAGDLLKQLVLPRK